GCQVGSCGGLLVLDGFGGGGDDVAGDESGVFELFEGSAEGDAGELVVDLVGEFAESSGAVGGGGGGDQGPAAGDEGEDLFGAFPLVELREHFSFPRGDRWSVMSGSGGPLGSGGGRRGGPGPSASWLRVVMVGHCGVPTPVFSQRCG